MDDKAFIFTKEDWPSDDPRERAWFIYNETIKAAEKLGMRIIGSISFEYDIVILQFYTDFHQSQIVYSLAQLSALSIGPGPIMALLPTTVLQGFVEGKELNLEDV